MENLVEFNKSAANYVAIDLGLSSGTLWSNMNIGATSETDYGLYFQWGDTVGYTSDQVGSGDGQKYFSWDDYKYSDDSEITMTKYCDNSLYGKDGFTDNLTTLESSDDAATVNMGSRWKMPTKAQIQELVNETTNEWTSINGVNGYKFTNKADSSKYIFIPAAGGLWGGTAYGVGEGGCCWSSSLYEDYCNYAWGLSFDADFVLADDLGNRYDGLPVRGVTS